MPMKDETPCACACGHEVGEHTWAGCVVVVGPNRDDYCYCTETFGDTMESRNGQVPSIATYGQIRLRRDGDYSVVSILIGGQEIDIIRELFDSNFDHLITPDGIQTEVQLHNERHPK